MIRAAFYFDGFNTYHAIDDLGAPYLKWVDYASIAQKLIPQRSEALARVVVCTAARKDDPVKLARHTAFMRALQARGVDCVRGHFLREPRTCLRCGHTWQAPVEKQGDVNLAISIIDDAHRDVFDHCYLVTADSDQAATARLLKERFPGKRLTTVAPPGRQHSQNILKFADANLTISRPVLEACLLPAQLTDAKGVIVRPVAYCPPKK